jgi:hypothetical protein
VTYPLQPLLDMTGITRGQFAKHAHISGTEAARLETEGLTEAEADRYAVRCGYPTAYVWPDWIFDALSPLEQIFDRMRSRGAA